MHPQFAWCSPSARLPSSRYSKASISVGFTSVGERQCVTSSFYSMQHASRLMCLGPRPCRRHRRSCFSELLSIVTSFLATLLPGKVNLHCHLRPRHHNRQLIPSSFLKLTKYTMTISIYIYIYICIYIYIYMLYKHCYWIDLCSGLVSCAHTWAWHSQSYFCCGHAVPVLFHTFTFCNRSRSGISWKAPQDHCY